MGWEDIEEMPTTNLREGLLCLLEREVEYGPSPADGVDRASSARGDGPDQIAVADDDGGAPPEAVRRHICQWAYECADYFLLDREVVHLSMHYYDRYMSIEAARDGGTARPSMMLCHLLALSSLYVACKVHGVTTELPSSSHHRGCEGGVRPRKLRLQDFCNMSRGTYCPAMLEEMELSLLSNLAWRLHPPTPSDFLVGLVKMLSLSLDEDLRTRPGGRGSAEESVGRGWSVYEVARYQIELAVYSAELCDGCPPSRIALAAVLNAVDSKVVRTKRTVVPSRVREAFLQRVSFLGGGFATLDAEGDDVVRARGILKRLCSKTIVLPGQALGEGEDDRGRPPAPARAKSFEYELPDVHSISSSPVSVAAADGF